MFDEQGCFVFWNARFAEVYGAGIEIQVGTRFDDHLRRAIATGLVPAALGREDEWLAERLRRFESGEGTHEHRLGNGRWVRVQDRVLPNGGRVGIRSDVTDLVEREQSFRLLYDVNPTPMLVVDRDTLDLLSVNDAAVAFYGYSRDTLLGLKLTDVRPEAEPGEIRAAIGRMQQTTMRGARAIHRLANGEERIVKVNGRLFDYNGRPAVLAALFDVTEQHRMEEEVRRTRAFLEEVVDQVPTPLFVKDVEHEGRYVLYNKAAESMFGMPRTRVMGRAAEDIFEPDYVAKLAAQDSIVMATGGFEAAEDEVLRRSDGSTRLIRTRKVAFNQGVGTTPRFIVGVAEDVTEQRAAAARIAFLAHHDQLTELPNRALFQDRLSAALAALPGHRDNLALFYLDLDGFKAVNDAWGHAMGDALLQAVGVRLRTLIRESDTAARLGGDEFALIQVPVRRKQDAEVLAQRLVDTLSTPFAIQGQDLQIGASVGLALAPVHGLEARGLLARADAALYRAKREGRRTFRLAA